MNRKTPIFILILVATTSLIALVSDKRNPSEPKERSIDQIADEIMIDLAKNVKEKYHLRMVGTGGGGVYGLNLLSVHFRGVGEYPPDEAREALVDISLQFLSLINASEEFKARLKCFPFSTENIKIMIGFCTETGKRPDKQYISFMFLRGGKCYYCVDGDGIGPFEDAGEETIEEALAIVARSDNSEVSALAREYLLTHDLENRQQEAGASAL